MDPVLDQALHLVIVFLVSFNLEHFYGFSLFFENIDIFEEFSLFKKTKTKTKTECSSFGVTLMFPDG